MNNNPYRKYPVSKTVRRFLAVLLAGAMLFGLFGCAERAEQPSAGDEPITVKRDAGPQELQTANAAAALALRFYIYARLKLEEFIVVDIESVSEEEMESRMDELVLVWGTAEALASSAEDITNRAVRLLEAAEANRDKSFFSMFLAANGSLRLPKSLADSSGEVIDRQTWAENLSKQYDSLHCAQRCKELAKQLGVDTKTAAEQLELAQKIIHNAADLEDAQAEKDEYNRSVNTLEVYKTGSKVGLYIGATVATGGGSLASLAGSNMTLGQASVVIVGGVDCIVNVGETASTIVLGENHQVTMDFKKVGDVLQPFSMVMSLVTLQPGETADEIALIGESVMEWFCPGSITDILVGGMKSDGTRLVADVVDTADKNLPGVRDALEALGLSLPSEKGVSTAELTLEYTINSQMAMAGMQELTVQIAELEWEAENQPQETELFTPSAMPTQDAQVGEKNAYYEIRNVSGSAWVIDSSTDPEYFDDLDAIYAEDFIIGSGGSQYETIDVEARLQDGSLIELSPTTYSITVTFAAGEPPEDIEEQYVYLNPLYDGPMAQTYTLTITGTYNETVVIEWNGVSFTQVN